MPRLGELLVAAGLLTAEQVERALRAQVMWGGRLGTNLIELHYVELDSLSKVLARQHRLPAALARHFEKADPDLQRMLSPELAERFSCVPLLRMGPEKHVAVASLAPLSPRQLVIIAAELKVEVHRLFPAIAAELRIRYQLERVYSIRRSARFLRARGKSIPPFPAFNALPVAASEPDLDPPALSLPVTTQEMAVFRPPPPPPPVPPPPASSDDTFDDLIPIEVVAPSLADDLDDLDDLSRQITFDDDLAIPIETIEDEVTARQRRRYVPTIDDAPPADAEPQAQIGRIALRKIAVDLHPQIVAGATLEETTRAIRRSADRDRIADLVVDALERFAPTCEAAILLVVRGATAMGCKGFQRSGGLIGEIAVPIENGDLVPRVIEHNITLRKPCAELVAIDRLLLASLGRHTGDLAIVPIAIADQVMCVLAIAAATGAPLTCTEPIAAAAGAAFARLIRNTSR